MRYGVAGALAALVSAGGAVAQVPARDPGAAALVRYDVRFPDPAHHEARIAVTYSALNPGPVEFRMARSSPGRYALHEFAKNVYAVSAVDGRGRALAITRADPYSWTVAGHDGTVTVTYTLFGNRGDGTYSQVDPTHAHLNMPATFLWARGYDARAIRVAFHPLAGWKVATQLPSSDGTADTFWAPNLQYFMDSPTELSDFQMRTWQQDGADGRRYTMRLAVHSQDNAADVDRFADRTKKVIAQHFRLFGGPAPYDFGTYTFIADYMPQISGDGMEHRNSTFISQPRSLHDADFAQIDTLSHEFTHSWNVERLRPAELEPFDFTRADPTPSLWFAEGFTQYLGPLMIRRAGESSVDAYLRQLGGTVSLLVNSPARRYGGPQEMSLRAPFADAATAIDPVNATTLVSYYPYGATIALALDLTLRERYAKTLDDYMRLMWRRNGEMQRDYAPARPYHVTDLEAGLAELTGDAAFARTFFATTVQGSALPDFAPLLAPAGLTLRAARPGRGWLGATRFAPVTGKVVLNEAPAPGTPLYAAGVDRDDEIVSIDGRAVADGTVVAATLAAIRPAQKVRLVYRDAAGEHQATVTAAADPALEIVRSESAGAALTPSQQAFRDAWLGPAS